MSFSTFLNLLFFSHKRVNLDIDDVDFESMLLKSDKYLNQIKLSKDQNLAGQFLLSIVELGHLSVVKTIVHICELDLAKAGDGVKLVGMAMRNKDQKMVDFLLSCGIVVKPNPIEGSGSINPPEGYRHAYIDELLEDSVMWQAFMRMMSDWAIIAVQNGWTEGRGYGGKRTKDMGARAKNGGITWAFVSEAYPICESVRKTY